MRYFNEITLFENRRRVRLLQDFRNTTIDYFSNGRVDYHLKRVESKIAQAARVKVNHLMDTCGTETVVAAVELLTALNLINARLAQQKKRPK